MFAWNFVAAAADEIAEIVDVADVAKTSKLNAIDVKKSLIVEKFIQGDYLLINNV